MLHCAPVTTVLEWSMEEVGQWLDSLGLAEYQEHFMSHEIQGQELLTLGRQDLKVRPIRLCHCHGCSHSSTLSWHCHGCSHSLTLSWHCHGCSHSLTLSWHCHGCNHSLTLSWHCYGCSHSLTLSWHCHGCSHSLTLSWLQSLIDTLMAAIAN